MTKHWALSMLLVALVCATAQAGNITYTVNETITGPVNGISGNPIQTDSVVGSITTDGTIGVLNSPNILGWNLDLIDVTNPQYSYLLTTANSSIVGFSGSVLSATASGLFFDFSGSGFIGFQANSPGIYSGYHYWCLNANSGVCALGNSIAPDNVYGAYLGHGDDLVIASIGTQGQVGKSPLNPGPPPPPPSAPEPASLLLLGAGAASIISARRRKK